MASFYSNNPEQLNLQHEFKLSSTLYSIYQLVIELMRASSPELLIIARLITSASVRPQLQWAFACCAYATHLDTNLKDLKLFA